MDHPVCEFQYKKTPQETKKVIPNCVGQLAYSGNVATPVLLYTGYLLFIHLYCCHVYYVKMCEIKVKRLFSVIVYQHIKSLTSLSLYLSTCISVICLSVFLYICIFVICLSVFLYICLSVYLYLCLSVYMYICLSVYLSICLSVYLSIFLSVYYLH